MRQLGIKAPGSTVFKYTLIFIIIYLKVYTNQESSLGYLWTLKINLKYNIVTYMSKV